MFRVKRNDQVVILSGKDRGKRGKVLHLFPEDGRVIVEGLNVVKKHLRRSQSNPQGAIIGRECRIPVDRVQPICPRCNRGVRVGFKVSPGDAKARVCRRCGEAF